MYNKLKDIIEWIYCIIIAFIIAMFIKSYLGTPTIVKMKSMYPTLQPNNRIILNKLPSNKKKLPNRGEIVTFESPIKIGKTKEGEENQDVIAKYDKEPNNLIGKFFKHGLEINKITYIKRVIALPKDHIQIKENKVYINGQLLKETYLDESVKTKRTGDYYDLIVPEKSVFVMGDNREGSMDSRVFGCVPLEKIEGKVVVRFWPLNKFGKIK